MAKRAVKTADVLAETIAASASSKSNPTRQIREEDTIACPCTTFEQDESCPVGFPSLLCSACSGTGNAKLETVVALAAEMMKVAEQVDELEDPFAAWESIDLIKTDLARFRSERGYVIGVNTGFEEAIKQAASVVDQAAVDFEKQAGTTSDGQAHDALLMASDALELTAGEIRALAATEAGK